VQTAGEKPDASDNGPKPRRIEQPNSQLSSLFEFGDFGLQTLNLLFNCLDFTGLVGLLFGRCEDFLGFFQFLPQHFQSFFCFFIHDVSQAWMGHLHTSQKSFVASSFSCKTRLLQDVRRVVLAESQNHVSTHWSGQGVASDEARAIGDREILGAPDNPAASVRRTTYSDDLNGPMQRKKMS
jgi:hypothetical protein